MPLFLTAWGAQVYGEWLLLTSVVAYLSSDGSGGPALYHQPPDPGLCPTGYPTIPQDPAHRVQPVLVLPLAVFCVFVGVILLFPPGSLLQITVTSPTVVFLVLAILAFQFVFSLPQGILMGVYRAVGLLPRGVMLGNLMQVVTIVLVALGLWLKAGLVTIVFLQLLPALIVPGRPGT